MTSAAVFPWMFLAYMLASRKSAAAAPAPAPAPTPTPTAAPRPRPRPAAVPKVPAGTVPAVYKPEPWPVAVPAGLPPFPGPGWEPDTPPPAAVVARAQQLTPVLWARGAGTSKIEQTAGRWIAYRAAYMGSKRGVVAFRLREEAPAIKVGPAEVVPASAPAPKVVKAKRTGLRTLRLTSPRMAGEDVKAVQRRLGITADGVYGSGSYAAVKAFQRSKRLVVDGIVGPKTYAALFA